MQQAPTRHEPDTRVDAAVLDPSHPAVIELGVAVKENLELVAAVCYGFTPKALTVPSISHQPHGSLPPQDDLDNNTRSSSNKQYTYPASTSPFFTIPAHAAFSPSSSAVSHTRSLTFLKPLMEGPYFDLEAIWEEHTYYEFEDRSVEETMATMVAEPYVNHVPTITGGIGRNLLTKFYREHFIFSNSEDSCLELVSRTVGIDRVVDEFLFKCTHDRVVDWL
jgi:carboxymethylenebutenolidase